MSSFFFLKSCLVNYLYSACIHNIFSFYINDLLFFPRFFCFAVWFFFFFVYFVASFLLLLFLFGSLRQRRGKSQQHKRFETVWLCILKGKNAIITMKWIIFSLLYEPPHSSIHSELSFLLSERINLKLTFVCSA